MMYMETDISNRLNEKHKTDYLIIMDEMDMITDPFSYTLNIPQSYQ